MVDWRSLTLFPRSSMRNVEGRGGTRGIEGEGSKEEEKTRRRKESWLDDQGGLDK